MIMATMGQTSERQVLRTESNLNVKYNTCIKHGESLR